MWFIFSFTPPWLCQEGCMFGEVLFRNWFSDHIGAPGWTKGATAPPTLKEGFKEVFRVHSIEEVEKLIRYFKAPSQIATLQPLDLEGVEGGKRGDLESIESKLQSMDSRLESWEGCCLWAFRPYCSVISILEHDMGRCFSAYEEIAMSVCFCSMRYKYNNEICNLCRLKMLPYRLCWIPPRCRKRIVKPAPPHPPFKPFSYEF